MMSLVFVPFVLAFGYNEFSVHVLELAIFVGDLAGLYAVSLPLGSRLRIVPCVLLSFDPVLYLNMSEGRSLSLLILFALVVLWASGEVCRRVGGSASRLSAHLWAS